MKKVTLSQSGLIAGVALLGYGAGMVSLKPIEAQQNRGNTAPDSRVAGRYESSPTDEQGEGNQRREPRKREPRGRRPRGQGRDGKAGGPRLGHILAELELSDSQKTQIHAILEAERAQMDQLHDKTRSSVESLLTSEQRMQLKQVEQESPCGHHGPRQEAGSGAPDGEYEMGENKNQGIGRHPRF
ncbi:MAG TPA: hypothetical protein VF719_10600 [Abditibacteriaceae bacterium]|jgi:Spy/CpxP family protein refolding chaperone